MRRQAAAKRECPIDLFDIIANAIRKNHLTDRCGNDYLIALLKDPEVIEPCKQTPFGRTNLLEIALISGNARAVLALREGGFDVPNNLIVGGQIKGTVEFLNEQNDPALSSAVRKSIPRDNCFMTIRPLISLPLAVQG